MRSNRFVTGAGEELVCVSVDMSLAPVYVQVQHTHRVAVLISQLSQHEQQLVFVCCRSSARLALHGQS
jgi:hypothetical protein